MTVHCETAPILGNNRLTLNQICVINVLCTLSNCLSNHNISTQTHIHYPPGDQGSPVGRDFLSPFISDLSWQTITYIIDNVIPDGESLLDVVVISGCQFCCMLYLLYNNWPYQHHLYVPNQCHLCVPSQHHLCVPHVQTISVNLLHQSSPIWLVLIPTVIIIIIDIFIIIITKET